MLYFLLLLIICVSIIVYLLYNKIYVHTSTMAVVMAIGIITEGVLFNFFGMRFFQGVFGRILTVFALSLWCSFSFSFFMAFLHNKFSEIHYTSPINRFGIGTWVAGTSICGILIDKQFHEWVFIARVLSYLNIGLWIIYIGFCTKAFYDIRKKRLTKNVHGILLLTTVSTQSIVLLINTVFKNVPALMSSLLLSIGGTFYFISSILIIKRYCSKSDFGRVETKWNNTNCILHGAISITGLASIVSHAADRYGTMAIWVFAAVAFLAIECIEGYRLIKRIKAFGVKKGVWVYDISQWSRVFTFAMFYTFTYLNHPIFWYYSEVRETIILIGIWVILLLVFIEFLLFLSHLIHSYKQTNKPGDAPVSITSPL